MKTKYKHIHFVEALSDDAQPDYLCYNKSDEVLGWIEYYFPWRQYVFSTKAKEMVFSKSCLQDIEHFITQVEQSKEAE